MAYVSQYWHDVFISYAHKDNICDDDTQDFSEGWIFKLKKIIKVCLERRLGCGNEIDIFIDGEEVKSNSSLSMFSEAARNSAVFIAVLSPSYINSSMCNEEVESFIDAASSDRLFAIECLPLKENENYPSPLDDKIYAKFWKNLETGRVVPQTLSPKHDEKIFNKLAAKLAHDIMNKLAECRPKTSKTKRIKTIPLSNSSEKKRYVLGPALPEHLSVRESIYDYLVQHQVPVTILDAGPHDNTDAHTASHGEPVPIVIKFPGSSQASASPKPSENAIDSGRQKQRRNESNVIHYRLPGSERPERDEPCAPEQIGESVLVCSVERFKSHLLEEATRVQGNPTQPLSAIFLNTAQDDDPTAQALQAALEQRGIAPAMPACGGSHAERWAAFQSNLTRCRALILIIGEAQADWRPLSRLLSKLRFGRSTPLRTLGIQTGRCTENPEFASHFPTAVTRRWNQGEPLEPVLDLAGDMEVASQ